MQISKTDEALSFDYVPACNKKATCIQRLLCMYLNFNLRILGLPQPCYTKMFHVSLQRPPMAGGPPSIPPPNFNVPPPGFMTPQMPGGPPQASGDPGLQELWVETKTAEGKVMSYQQKWCYFYST